MSETKISAGTESADGPISAATQPHDSKRTRRRVLRIMRNGLVIYFGILLLLMFLEEKLIFFPMRHPAGDWQPAGLDFEDAEFTAADGTRLHGWYCPVPEPRATVLFSHGNAGNITHRVDEIALWQRHLRVSVFIYDYRGFGRSEGSPDEPGVYADARAAYRWLVTEKQIQPEKFVLRGESIGCAVSLQLGLEVPHGALILQSPFTSAVDMGQRRFPWLPARWIMRNRFDNAEKIRQYRGPVLIQHGELDSIVPFDMGRRLFELANDPKRFCPIRDADHNDVPFAGGDGFFRAIDEFLNEAIGRPVD
jgi:hypothetical protein